MKIVFNLIDDRELAYMGSVTPLEAVVQAYCMDNKLMSAWTHVRHSRAEGEFYAFTDTLPVTYGACSVACGDWVTLNS